MFTPTRLLANYDYNKGRRDEQKAVESVLETLSIQRLLDPGTLNLIHNELNKIDRRPKVEIK
jgi:hypothetical protein